MQDSPEDSEDEGVEAVDSRGIAGWDRVDALAEALLLPKGLAVTTEQARSIRALFDALDEFDKRPLSFSAPSSPRKLRGHFARSKKRRSGHVTVEMMKR